MTKLKVRSIGNSLGVILPKDALSQLHVGDGDTLYLTTAPDGAMRLTAYDPQFEDQMQAARKGMAKYRNALRELAK
ncbi:AbrB/MazE/SpoVT family DNA-binding domain-containing protein [Pelagibacterium sp. 26DY04]|uniref:AbrB/MazE/SpoVT family DNA-binding domain-containing protein n=1 Tax=unclassified Pelagibacterium TaxID=2623280 RepID=UPI002815C6E5|nr:MULTISPECIES: AbrB/MazE/SpoVT family DNA-binding domain-containing protein [unclassified Pelagibacterium]WMT85981.1 AbrB/MazE/SpoVT family DNA-binding domain-containing protein [Pelagibacterium sp. 26DY04]WMT89736.1 AbrB/MazE/SpoVT family DNA-binding domain-containing protein [Pelagibacterium sp. H642]